MKIRRATSADHERLFDIWFSAVRGSHHFLTEEGVQELIPYVRAYLASDEANLVVAVDADDVCLGFMGANGNDVESLFVAPEFQRRGVGKELLEYARERAGALTVSVNEQNPEAIRFYEAYGFVVVGRSETDSAGRPYPLLHMRQVAAGDTPL
jgi:putative acetyltransferase